MQNKIIIKVNKNQNSSNNIPKHVRKVNFEIKPNTAQNKIKFNTTSMDKNPKNITYKNYLKNTNISKDNLQKKLSMDKTPKMIKIKNYLTNINNTKLNTEQKILIKRKIPISKFSLDNKINSNNNTHQEIDIKNNINYNTQKNIDIKNNINNNIPKNIDIKNNINNTPKNIYLKNNRKIINSPTTNEGINNTFQKTENKNENDGKKIIYNKKIVNNYISKKSKETKIDDYEKLNIDKKYLSLTTFEKIVFLQKLLKEMTSIKERFEGNKNKMIEKLYFECFNYFNYKVYMKEIFDYCISRKPEEHRDYQLISNINDYLDKDIYKYLYDFYFLIRNDNNLMIKIISLSDKYVCEELSDFVINFFYENIINSSFAQEELLLIIYLLIEELFSKKIPNNEDLNNSNIYTSYIKNSFLFYAFKALTRKIDIRNFLSSILSDIILRIESFRVPLSLDINIVNRFLRNRSTNIHHSFIKFTKGDSENMKVLNTKKKLKKKFKTDLPYNQGTENGGSIFLKRTKKIELGSSNRFNDVEGSWILVNNKLNQSRTLNDSITNKSINSEINDDANNNILNKSKTNINKENQNIENKESIEIVENNDVYNSHNIDENLKIDELKIEIEIDPFFENNSVSKKYLNDKLLDLRKSINKSNINYAMKDYINSLIEQLENNKNEGKKNDNYISKNINDKYYEKVENINNNEDKEIYSTSVIIDELKTIREIKQEASFKELMKKIKINHKIVTKIIIKIINNIKDNLIYIPIIIKLISKILNALLEKKFTSLKINKLSYFNLYMFKINFLIGNIFLPIISNPEFNGIITTNIISQITSDNLKLISDIFNKMLSGELFTKNDEPYLTLFNQFIIETMPNLFELVENLEKNLGFPEKIQKLIYDKNKNNDRNINYDFFKENPNENIQYESICFSWQDLYILLQIVSKYKNIFIDENNNTEQKIIFEKILENKGIFINLFSYGIKSKKSEFFILTKINYKDEFEKKLTSITNNNFNLIIPKLNDDLITAYKKCLIEVLNYVNIMHKKNLKPLSLRKDEIIYDPYIYKILNKNNRKDIYKNIVNKYSYSNIITNELKPNFKNIPIIINGKEEADFRCSILPIILDNIKYEISYNLDNPNSQKIIFCCNYLKLYARNIPKEYKKNNNELLFSELINETQKNIEYLKTNIIFEYYLKLKEVEKSNILLANYNSQIRNLEKIKCIEYLYNKLELPIKLNIKKNQRGVITNIEYIKEDKNNEEKNKENDLNNSINIMDYLENRNQPINNFIDAFPDFHDYEEEFDNILDIEEKANAPDAINDYFHSLKKILKKEKIINRFNKQELESIIYDLQNYILTKLYDKLFPSESTKDDIFFYKKCSRLSFIKPENIIADKKMINESLMEKAIDHLNDIDDKLTPVDKIKSLAKAIEIVQNSITFSSGKDELGVDDTIKPLMYIMIKSRPKNISSNFQYCELYLNSELSKNQYGVVLSQIGLIIGIIKQMKYSDLIGISEEQFGIDEIEEDDDEK